MDLIPTRRLGSRRDEETGKLMLLIPKFRGRLTGRWIQPRLHPDRAYFKLHLDGMGAEIWERIDACRPLSEIFQDFSRNHPEEPELVDRFARFIRNLMKEEFIGMRLPDPAVSVPESVMNAKEVNHVAGH